MLLNEIEMLLELNNSGTPSIVSLCNILLQKIKYSKLDRYRIIIDVSHATAQESLTKTVPDPKISGQNCPSSRLSET